MGVSKGQIIKAKERRGTEWQVNLSQARVRGHVGDRVFPGAESGEHEPLALGGVTQ